MNWPARSRSPEGGRLALVQEQQPGVLQLAGGRVEVLSRRAARGHRRAPAWPRTSRPRPAWPAWPRGRSTWPSGRRFAPARARTIFRTATLCTRPADSLAIPPSFRHSSVRDVEAVQPIEDPPRLLGPNQVVVDVARIGQGFVNRLAGDLVKHHPLHGDLRLEHLGQVPTDGLPLAVFVRRQVELAGVFEQSLELADLVLLIARDDVDGLEVLVNVHAQIGPVFAPQLLRHFLLAFGQVADVANAGLNGEALAEELADRARLGRRLDDHQGLAGRVGGFFGAFSKLALSLTLVVLVLVLVLVLEYASSNDLRGRGRGRRRGRSRAGAPTTPRFGIVMIPALHTIHVSSPPYGGSPITTVPLPELSRVSLAARRCRGGSCPWSVEIVMASPFTRFRKNQKKWLAFLGVVCMFTFVIWSPGMRFGCGSSQMADQTVQTRVRGVTTGELQDLVHAAETRGRVCLHARPCSCAGRSAGEREEPRHDRGRDPAIQSTIRRFPALGLSPGQSEISRFAKRWTRGSRCKRPRSWAIEVSVTRHEIHQGPIGRDGERPGRWTVPQRHAHRRGELYAAFANQLLAARVEELYGFGDGDAIELSPAERKELFDRQHRRAHVRLFPCRSKSSPLRWRSRPTRR